MAQHSNYWSCTTFADWLRGTEKLSAGTSEEWDNWRLTAKMKHNFRYWLAEEGLDHIQDFVTWPIRKLYDIKYYVNNRWVTGTHRLTAHSRDIKPGTWCDVSNRFLPCMFNELVDFVEIESAWSHIAWSEKAEREKYNAPFWATGWFRWRTWRCPQAGVDHLNWASGLTVGNSCGVDPDHAEFNAPTWQANNSREILALYNWWTQVYRNRPDPYEASGWSAYCDRMRVKYPDSFLTSLNSRDKEDRKESDKASKLLRKIEAQYEKEDTDMMVRLIKVRNALWT